MSLNSCCGPIVPVPIMSQERHTTVNPTLFLYFLQKAPEANLKALKKQKIGQNVSVLSKIVCSPRKL